MAYELDVRCNMEDARLAVESGVDGVDVVIGTSSFLQNHSHGKDMAYITKSAIEVINYIKRFANLPILAFPSN